METVRSLGDVHALLVEVLPSAGMRVCVGTPGWGWPDVGQQVLNEYQLWDGTFQ